MPLSLRFFAHIYLHQSYSLGGTTYSLADTNGDFTPLPKTWALEPPLGIGAAAAQEIRERRGHITTMICQTLVNALENQLDGRKIQAHDRYLILPSIDVLDYPDHMTDQLKTEFLEIQPFQVTRPVLDDHVMTSGFEHVVVAPLQYTLRPPEFWKGLSAQLNKIFTELIELRDPDEYGYDKPPKSGG